ncbi:serine/threonine protein phosphatase [Lysinibacillus sp. OL1_EC]|uniref:serine/threonine protein phosphatase n=1 Tax=Lysinibacillus TaxID=400634 RepID=UPI000A77EF2D|nr:MULTISPECIES: serine/threonine protein phosphatase [Lysinibacillus]MCM0627283.1 serine/threonine protein phosphatase [Lysinibacillus sp. OL1_EC]MCS5503776.1 serine/threonine protein phosphatase [Lysinibacillus sp. A4]UKJ43935.1 serine/threonine protein phosphatase [Lysinibacillus sp. ACHW1.5]WGT37877.1 serine/threonine protein phosphatase [Lysinibacillus sp. 1 U-2021]
MRKENSDFKTSFLSEAGSFLQNKDYFAYTELDDVACWVAVKGLDSDQEISSAELAVKAILEKFMEKPSMSRRSIKKYLKNAQAILQAQSLRVRLKASIVIVISDYSKMIVAVAGNSRLYHFRNGTLSYKTTDQSLAQEIVNSRNRSLDISQHEERSNLLNYLGKPEDFKPFVSKKMKLLDGDVLVLCTAGFWEDVNEIEMADALEDTKDPEQYTDLLEEVLLSRQRKVVNNYTIATIFANKVYQETNKKKMKYIKMIAAALIVALVVGGSTIFYQAKQAKKMAELTVEMKDHEKSGNLYFQDGNYEKALLEYSEGRNAAKKLKDPIHRNLLAKKLRITDLILNGDKSAEAGKFTDALEQYEKAKKEGKLIKNFGKEATEQRIANMDTIVQIAEAVKDGDFRFEAEDYNGALETYEKARKKALTISYTGEPQIKTKIEETEAKIAELKKAQKELKAEGLEKSGDQSYARQEYGKAIEYYTLAQEIYQETELLSKVLGLERKVMNANDKLNPPPQAPATDIDPSYEAAIPFEEGAAANESSDAEVMKEGK